MTARQRPVLVGVAWTTAVLVLAAPSRSAPAAADVASVHGVPCVAASDLARLLDGVQYWRADTRKLVIRVRGHRLTLTEGVPIALLDDHTLRLDAPVRSLGGELQVPLSLLSQLPVDSGSTRLVVDEARRRVRVAPVEGFVGAPRVSVTDDVTRVRIGTARAGEARVTSRDRRHFRVWLPGAAGSGSIDALPEGSRVRGLRRLPGRRGVTWELTLDETTAGWRLSTGPEGAVLLDFSSSPVGFERLASATSGGPRSLRVVVLDPGHGGADAGVGVPGVSEKELTLRLARLLATELEQRAGSHVLLTRDTDRTVPQSERAEIANRSRADLVLSLHFDGAPLTRARGATAWCPRLGDDERTGGSSAVEGLKPWRDVAAHWSGASRALADEVCAALEARGQGPARARERLPVPLLGVNAPGLLLECATLTSGEDLARVSAPEGLRTLASAIADGVIEWGRHE